MGINEKPILYYICCFCEDPQKNDIKTEGDFLKHLESFHRITSNFKYKILTEDDF